MTAGSVTSFTADGLKYAVGENCPDKLGRVASLITGITEIGRVLMVEHPLGGVSVVIDDKVAGTIVRQPVQPAPGSIISITENLIGDRNRTYAVGELYPGSLTSRIDSIEQIDREFHVHYIGWLIIPDEDIDPDSIVRA